MALDVAVTDNTKPIPADVLNKSINLTKVLLTNSEELIALANKQLSNPILRLFPTYLAREELFKRRDEARKQHLWNILNYNEELQKSTPWNADMELLYNKGISSRKDYDTVLYKVNNLSQFSTYAQMLASNTYAVIGYYSYLIAGFLLLIVVFRLFSRAKNKMRWLYILFGILLITSIGLAIYIPYKFISFS